jgi:hypothetical protein
MGRLLLCSVLLTACASRSTSPAANASATQDVRAGLEVLCVSRWNGELYGNRLSQWIPDEVHTRVTNEEVRRLATALSGPVRDRTAMFDAFVAENHIVDLPSCPFRSRLANWPAELPIIPANKNEPTPSL